MSSKYRDAWKRETVTSRYSAGYSSIQRREPATRELQWKRRPTSVESVCYVERADWFIRFREVRVASPVLGQTRSTSLHFRRVHCWFSWFSIIEV